MHANIDPPSLTIDALIGMKKFKCEHCEFSSGRSDHIKEHAKVHCE